MKSLINRFMCTIITPGGFWQRLVGKHIYMYIFVGRSHFRRKQAIKGRYAFRQVVFSKSISMNRNISMKNKCVLGIFISQLIFLNGRIFPYSVSRKKSFPSKLLNIPFFLWGKKKKLSSSKLVQSKTKKRPMFAHELAVILCTLSSMGQLAFMLEGSA